MMKYTIPAMLLVVTLASCAQPDLTVRELAQYRKILDSGVPAMRLKDPVLASVLNVGFGAGFFYLEEWGRGIVSFLLAPISWLWGIPAGYLDARRINVRYTLEYYKRLEVHEVPD